MLPGISSLRVNPSPRSCGTIAWIGVSLSLVAQPLSRFNLSESTILVLESTGPELHLYARILVGFGARKIHRCESIAQAEVALSNDDIDLMIVDAKLADADGCGFVRQLRRTQKCASVPVLMVAGHTPRNRIAEARDCGAHFVVRKPVSPAAILQRILWIAQENRPFVECAAYVGPERRFRTDAVEPGAGRRSSDIDVAGLHALNSNIGEGASAYGQASA